MAFYKESTEQPFTTIINETLQDSDLTAEATGVLCFMLSLPTNWKYSSEWLQKQKNNLGEHKLKRILKELENYGYLTRKRQIDQKGRFTKSDWIVRYKKKINDDDTLNKSKTKALTPQGDYPLVDNPQVDNQGLQIKHKENKQEQTTTTNIKPAKIEFETFKFCLITTIQAMLQEGGWIHKNMRKPKASWLNSKASNLYYKFCFPDPADCAAIILNDWVRINNMSMVSQESNLVE